LSLTDEIFQKQKKIRSFGDSEHMNITDNRSPARQSVFGSLKPGDTFYGEPTNNGPVSQRTDGPWFVLKGAAVKCGRTGQRAEGRYVYAPWVTNGDSHEVLFTEEPRNRIGRNAVNLATGVLGYFTADQVVEVVNVNLTVSNAR